MLLGDGTWSFDTKEIDDAVIKQQHDWYERDMLNAFTRYAYYRYKQIRDCVNSRKCKHMTIVKVRDQLTDDSKMQFICDLLRISDDEVKYIVEFADKHLQYVK